MDKIEEVATYHAMFCAGLERQDMAGWSATFWKEGFSVDEALAWANHGWTPKQALRLIELEVTPAVARAIWDAADTIESATDEPLSREEMARRIQILNELQ